jgi:hypothetical protein
MRNRSYLELGQLGFVIFVIVFTVLRNSKLIQNMEFSIIPNLPILSINHFVFDEEFWFKKHRLVETFAEGFRRERVLDHKTFGMSVKGPSERKDIFVHSAAWGLVVNEVFAQNVFQYYICSGRLDENGSRPTKVDFFIGETLKKPEVKIHVDCHR